MCRAGARTQAHSLNPSPLPSSSRSITHRWTEFKVQQIQKRSDHRILRKKIKILSSRVYFVDSNHMILSLLYRFTFSPIAIAILLYVIIAVITEIVIHSIIICTRSVCSWQCAKYTQVQCNQSQLKTNTPSHCNCCNKFFSLRKANALQIYFLCRHRRRRHRVTYYIQRV